MWHGIAVGGAVPQYSVPWQRDSKEALGLPLQRI